METPYFEIKPVKIEGVSEPLRKEIEGLVRSFADGKHNLFTINSQELARQIAQHPRIRDIQIQKMYPDQLMITAVEREQVAVATTDNGFFLIDNDGHVMDMLESTDPRILEYPFITGLRTEEVYEGEPVKSASLAHALNLLQVLEVRNAALYKRVSQIEIRGDDVSPLETLVVHMDSGLEVRFGDSNPVDRLPELETLLQKLDADYDEPFEELVYIDLRFDDMAFYMDKETAWDILRNNYDDVQRLMDQKNEEYRKKNPEEPYKAPTYGSQSGSRVAGAGSSSQQKNSSAARSSPRPATRQAAPAAAQAQNYAGYQNYQQSAQQYYQPQYNQPQRQYQYQQPQRAQQPASLYNLPANQPRY